jgi:5-hydroxyisourate hydrolase
VFPRDLCHQVTALGRLTTHVLDTSSGRPAAGLSVTLVRVSDGAILTQRITNSDGRVDAPLLQGDEMQPGTYELQFEVAAYFQTTGVSLPDPPFLGMVPIRFGIADPAAHYHVPLLVSPFGFSTYRGS